MRYDGWAMGGSEWASVWDLGRQCGCVLGHFATFGCLVKHLVNACPPSYKHESYSGSAPEAEQNKDRSIVSLWNANAGGTDRSTAKQWPDKVALNYIMNICHLFCSWACREEVSYSEIIYWWMLVLAFTVQTHAQLRFVVCVCVCVCVCVRVCVCVYWCIH